MALDVATLPLILYIVRYIHIEHVLHCENIIHIPTLFYYFAIPTPFFSFPMFFLLVHALFSLHSLSTIDILQSMI